MTMIATPVPAGGKRLVLRDISWKTYELLLLQLSRPRLFLTYFRGTLELMAPSYSHDKGSGWICRLIQTMAEEFDLPISSAGTTTFRKRDLKIGLEADEAFYIRNEQAVRGLKEIDLTITPPPDLVVEVEISPRLGRRKSMYARLGVPEVWQYNGDQIRVSVLQSAGKYQDVQRSPTFPLVELSDLARFARLGAVSNETQWIRDFREYLRKLPGRKGLELP